MNRGVFSAYPFIPMTGLGATILRVFALALAAFFIYNWLYTGVLKRGTHRLDEQGIFLKVCTGGKRITWDEIAGVESYVQKGNASFGIVTKTHLKKRKQNFLHALYETFGGLYSLIIPLSTFPTAEDERLYATIITMAAQAQESSQSEPTAQEDNSHSEPSGQETAEQTAPLKKSGVLRVLLTSLLIALGVGAANGLLMMPFPEVAVLLSVLGLIGLLYLYLKSDNDALNRLWIRFLFGLICSLEVLVAPFVYVITYVYKPGMLSSFGVWLKLSFIYITRKSEFWIPVAAFGGFCFIIEFTSGMSFRILRRIKQRFMKRKNGFTIEKDERCVSLYAVDYASFDENHDKQCLSLGPNYCLIEESGKDIDAFYLPEIVASEYGVNSDLWRKVTVEDEQYYMFDLGTCGQPRKYGYSCRVILGPNKEVEVIRLEID